MGILINTEPTVKYGTTELTLPMPKKMYIDALRETIRHENFDHQIEEKMLGFRLVAEYEWSGLTQAQVDDIIDFVNSPKKKYQKIASRYFEVLIAEFTKPNSVLQRDDCILKLKSKYLIGNYPNPDDWYQSFIYFEMPVGIYQ